jgi:hypothetical protein
MKKISIVLAVLALALLFSTCSKATDNPTTIGECIANFNAAINSADRSGVYKNLDPLSAKYAEAATPLFWNTYFPPAEIPYTLAVTADTGVTVTESITSSVTYTAGSTLTFTMGMDSSSNAVISKIDLYRPVGLGWLTTTIFE